ncbi:MAG: hypothetical protein HGA87_03205 [Desulfobulbaceae bacterium]|nr:hypothetical protein [Desulfobulbaceae bacterium]
MTRQYGDCYEASLKNAEELQLIKDAVEQSVPDGGKLKDIYDYLGLSESIRIVHGTAIPPNGIDEGRSIIHAWIEVGDLVIETSNGQKLPISKTEYYANHGISPLRHYLVTEARCLVNMHGKYGPWHLMEVLPSIPPEIAHKAAQDR